MGKKGDTREGNGEDFLVQSIELLSSEDILKLYICRTNFTSLGNDSDQRVNIVILHCIPFGFFGPFSRL